MSFSKSDFATSAFTNNHLASTHVREMIETESNYVCALETILRGFAKPLEGFLKRDEYQLLFGHIKSFHQIHFHFYGTLTKAASKYYNHDLMTLSPPRRNNNIIQTSSNPSTPTLNSISHFLSGSSSTPIVQDPRGSPSPFSNHLINNNRAASSDFRQINNALKISTCFLNIRNKFLKYGDYCAELPRAQALLHELSKNEMFALQLERCQQEANDGKFKLGDLLSIPMQRILKYHLLLCQIIKNTSANDDDLHGLERAYHAMLDLGIYINEVKRDVEHMNIINVIEQSIHGLIMPHNTQLTDYGRLVIDGFIRVNHPTCSKTTRPLDETKVKRYVFVFDKVMIICKMSGVSKYQYKDALILGEYQIDENPAQLLNETNVKNSTKNDKYSHHFNLINLRDRTIHSFFTKTSEMKYKWIDAVTKAMDNIKPEACRLSDTNHEFLMHTFDEASSCDHCGKLLWGRYYQGYRCAHCFISIHKKCLSNVEPCGPALLPRPQQNHGSSRRHCRELPVPTINTTFHDELNNNNSSMVNQNNTSTIPVVSQPSPTPRNQYINSILEHYPWFCGRMERDEAQSHLERQPCGTFLVRVSMKHNGSYVISLNHDSQVKHMRVYVAKDNQLYLSQNRYFSSIVELVSWYEQNSLVESFHMLDTTLAHPFKPPIYAECE